MVSTNLRTGILGAGFISEYHVQAISKQPKVQLIGVCDLNEPAAQRLASTYPGAQAYNDLDKMLAEANLDVVHILTQPDNHFVLAKKIIAAGCHCIIEKPVTINSKEAESLSKLAKEKNISIAVNHNFVFSRPFNELRAMLDQGTLGPLKSIRVVWKKILPQTTFGPWNLWMLRAPENILFETGSHSLSELLAIVNTPKIINVDARMPKVLPSGSTFYRRWNISASDESTRIQIDTAFDQGYEQHFIEVEGMFGVALADIENDVFSADIPTGRLYDPERFHVNFRGGVSRVRQAFRTYGSYLASKFISSPTGAPYETSMLNGIENCYKEISGGSDRRESSLAYAISIAKTAEAIQAKMPTLLASKKSAIKIPEAVAEPKLKATVLVIGASGFIGKRLLLALQNKGVKIRVLVRNVSSLVGLEIKDNCEIMMGDFRDQKIVDKALKDIKVVYNLAVAHSNSLDGYIKSDIEPTKKLIELCKEHNIERFIYTGTIDSLYLGPDAGKIKESDGLDSQIEKRNNYAHSKAMSEVYLNKLYQDEKFPVVIIRPAIVLGTGGSVAHPGVANWFGLGKCSFWGDGKNNLPLVLVDDIVDGLIRAMETQGIEGNTYNLSAESCLSAQDYVAEVEKVLGSKINKESSSYLTHYANDMTKWVLKVIARHPDAKRRPSTRDWRCREQHGSFDITAAQEDLGWKPTNDRETIVEKGIREPTRLFLES